MLRPQSKGFTALMSALVALTALSIDISLPALPALQQVFGVGSDRAQLTLSLFLLGYAGAQLVYGPLADRWGRRPVLLAGLALFAVASVGCALSSSIGALLSFRLLQGAGACAGPVLARAMVRDLFAGAQAAAVMASLALMMGFAPLLAPSLGGWLLAWFGWRSIYVVLSLIAVAALAGVWLGLGETLARERRGPSRGLWHTVLQGRRFLGNRHCLAHGLVVCFIFGGTFAFISGSPFVLMQAYGVGGQTYGLLFGLTAMALLIGFAANRQLLQRRAPRAVLGAGLALAGLAGSVLAVQAVLGFGGLAGLLAPMAAYQFAVGLVLPNAMAAALEPVPEIAGFGSSLLGSLQMTGAGLAGYLANALYDGSAAPMALVIAAMGLASLAAFHLLARPSGQPDGDLP
jgi:DHA1 family bicyclomycin/chloramphenicol resistance-like MFS transporter